MAMNDYYRLTKPGIVRGNMIHTLAGVIFAHAYGIGWSSALGVILGTSLVVASACVLNNYIDRDIDSKMERTRGRPSVTGSVPFLSGMIFAAVLFTLGFSALLLYTNLLVALIGMVAFVFYVIIYAVAKRRTVHSTLIGAIPGALPALAGYVAISGRLDVAAWLLFGLILVWQMPHFYAISIFRRKDYEAAGLPVLGVVRGFDAVKLQTGAYIAVYIALIVALVVTESMGLIGGIFLFVGGMYWAWVYTRPVADEVKWARRIFGVSLLLTIVLLVAVATDALVSSSLTLQ